MKIIFIGAGMASLVASERLARAGYDVSVFEKDAYENLSYDWHDDVNRDAFDMFGLPLPKDDTYFPETQLDVRSAGRAHRGEFAHSRKGTRLVYGKTNPCATIR